jgi:methylmalonyl-CoA/ethylmalonyl-CoA epimerase
MIGNLNHIAIVVPDIKKAVEVYNLALGAKVSDPVDLTDHGVRVIFVELENTKIELLLPIGTNSPVASFLKRNPSGGIHHICYSVKDILHAKNRCIEQGLSVIGSGEPQIGAHGKPVLFLHPKDLCGTLIELEQT